MYFSPFFVTAHGYYTMISIEQDELIYSADRTSWDPAQPVKSIVHHWMEMKMPVSFAEGDGES